METLFNSIAITLLASCGLYVFSTALGYSLAISNKALWLREIMLLPVMLSGMATLTSAACVVVGMYQLLETILLRPYGSPDPLLNNIIMGMDVALVMVCPVLVLTSCAILALTHTKKTYDLAVIKHFAH